MRRGGDSEPKPPKKDTKKAGEKQEPDKAYMERLDNDFKKEGKKAPKTEKEKFEVR